MSLSVYLCFWYYIVFYFVKLDHTALILELFINVIYLVISARELFFNNNCVNFPLNFLIHSKKTLGVKYPL